MTSNAPIGHYMYPSEWRPRLDGYYGSRNTDLQLPSDPSWSILHTITYVVNVYVDGALCLLGFVGNVLVIVILQRDRCKTSNNFLMQVLAVYDLLLLVFVLFYTTLRTVFPATGHMEWYHNHSPHIIAYVLPLGWMAQTGNNWITTALAGDRYLAISKPFKAVCWCTLGNAKRASILLSVLNFLFNFPRFIHYHLVAFQTESNSTFVSHVKFNMSGWNSDVYHYLYHITLTCTFLFILPLSSLIFFNHKLIKALRASSHVRRRLSVHEGRKRRSNLDMNSQVTLNIVVLITKFIICQLPDFTMAVLGAFGASHEYFAVLSAFAQMMLVFNSSANFYVYLIFNHKFRKVFKTAWIYCTSRTSWSGCLWCKSRCWTCRRHEGAVYTVPLPHAKLHPQDDITVTLTATPKTLITYGTTDDQPQTFL